MKKIHYSVFLYIGLLSLSTLFSCTNTRQEMNQDRAEKGLLEKFPNRPTVGDMKRFRNRNPKKILFAAIGSVALLGSGAAAYSISNMFSEGSNVSDFNSTNFTTISPYQFESSTIGLLNETGWNTNVSTGAELAYSAYDPSSTTVRNGNLSSISEKDDSNFQEDLLKDISNVNQKDHIKIYELDVALNNEDNNQLRILLMQPNVKVNEINSPIGPPITIAISKVNIESVRLLLQHEDIDVNKKNNYGDYPIHEAIYKCNPEILKLLLKDGRVTLDVRGGDNKKPMEIARELPDSQCKNDIINDLKDAISKQKKQNISDIKIKKKNKKGS